MAPFRKKRKGDIREMIPDRTQNQGPTKWCIVVQTNNLCLAVRLTMIRIESSSAKFIIIIIIIFFLGGGGGGGQVKIVPGEKPHSTLGVLYPVVYLLWQCVV